MERKFNIFPVKAEEVTAFEDLLCSHNRLLVCWFTKFFELLHRATMKRIVLSFSIILTHVKVCEACDPLHIARITLNLLTCLIFHCESHHEVIRRCFESIVTFTKFVIMNSFRSADVDVRIFALNQVLHF